MTLPPITDPPNDVFTAIIPPQAGGTTYAMFGTEEQRLEEDAILTVLGWGLRDGNVVGLVMLESYPFLVAVDDAVFDDRPFRCYSFEYEDRTVTHYHLHHDDEKDARD
jgi:hypothetical protein